jgi:hypothetical protein
MGWGHLKNLRKAEFYMKAFWHGTKASWLYYGPQRVKWGNEMHIIFLYGPRLIRWAMWPMGLLFVWCSPIILTYWFMLWIFSRSINVIENTQTHTIWIDRFIDWDLTWMMLQIALEFLVSRVFELPTDQKVIRIAR